MSKHHQRICDGQTGVRVIVPATHRASTNHFFVRNCAQSAPVAVAIISRSKSNYDQFGFARIRTNIKRFVLKFGARCMGCVPISWVERFVCLFESAMTSVIYIFKRNRLYAGFATLCSDLKLIVGFSGVVPESASEVSQAGAFGAAEGGRGPGEVRGREA